jgi:hypothetical protein
MLAATTSIAPTGVLHIISGTSAGPPELGERSSRSGNSNVPRGVRQKSSVAEIVWRMGVRPYSTGTEMNDYHQPLSLRHCSQSLCPRRWWGYLRDPLAASAKPLDRRYTCSKSDPIAWAPRCCQHARGGLGFSVIKGSVMKGALDSFRHG